MFDPNSATVAPLFITLSVASAEAAAALSRASQIQAEIAHALGGDQGVALIPLSRPAPDLSRGWGSRPRNLDAPHAADVGKALEDLQIGGLPRSIIALACGVTPPTISKWSTGKSCPRPRQIARLNRLLTEQGNGPIGCAPRP